MQQLRTKAIVLSRHNYRETDRIVNVLTPELGKFGLIAKGVRSMKSRLAGGIELFSVNDIVFIKGRSDLATLISSRLDKNFSDIIKDIERVQYGYEILRIIDRNTEYEVEPEYFNLLAMTLSGLNDSSLSISVIKLWFLFKLLIISGHGPNLLTDNHGVKLSDGEVYGFDADTMSFFVDRQGRYSVNHIKFLRVLAISNNPLIVAKVNGVAGYSKDLMSLIVLMGDLHLNS